MKYFIAFILALGFTTMASAEVCTSAIKDRSGFEFATFTSVAYSQAAACNQSFFECNDMLRYGQSAGRYYGAFCEVKNNTQQIICQTDLVDYYGQTVRSFTSPGQNEIEACNSSDNFCKVELARNDSYGYHCINKGILGRGPNHDHDHDHDRNKTEQCTANRLDPAGMFIQSYNATATGPFNSDVLGEACRNAMNNCSSEIRGRQTCNIAR